MGAQRPSRCGQAAGACTAVVLLSRHWSSFRPDFQAKLLLESIGMYKIRSRAVSAKAPVAALLYFFFFTLVTGPRRPLSLELSNTRVYGP